jgi:hypothetical protein
MSAFTDLADRLKKPKPHLLARREQRAKVASQDRLERQKCRLRSGGQCEVITVTFRPESSAVYKKRAIDRYDADTVRFYHVDD